MSANRESSPKAAIPDTTTKLPLVVPSSQVRSALTNFQEDALPPLLVLTAMPRHIGNWPGWVSIVIQRVSVKLSIPCRPPKRP